MFERGKKMKQGKVETTLKFNRFSNVFPFLDLFTFPDLFPNKKLNIETGMRFFRSNILNYRD